VDTEKSGPPRGAPKSRVEDASPKRTAVALHYQPVNTYTAPKVVASGRGWVAEKILEVAFAHGIKVREDADLAEILTAVDLDEEIPVEAFIAVAEILRYVYAANGTQPPEV
jgi:flagellar biosynthesis protein